MAQEYNREYYNNRLLTLLHNYLKRYKEMRFHQALQNLGINERLQDDRFFEESEDTFNIVKNRLGNESLERIEHFV